MRPLTETTFGDLLREKRTETGLTQELLAERASLSVRAISDLERGINRYPYRSTVRSLAQALGLSESESADLFAKARRPGRGSESPVIKKPMPSAMTPMVGRQHELAVILRLARWDGVRFLTLVGPGGVGKTRIAEDLARELEEDSEGGSVFVSLAGLSEASTVPSAVAAALDLRVPPGSSFEEALVATLRHQELFLVLDNFEHVLAAANLVPRLLAECPKVKVLVTSREPLHLRGEHQVEIAPLALPPLKPLPDLPELREVPAVSLFLQRARAVSVGFDVDATNAQSVADICRQLDGLPLALELAAARVKHTSVESLAEHVKHRLDVLGPGPRDLATRQRTMRATVEWSYKLLTAEEQALFRCASVFAGGGECAAAVELAAELIHTLNDPLGTLEALAEKSLLKLESNEGEPYFRMLETVREYGCDQVIERGEEGALRSAHAQFFLRFAEQAYPELKGHSSEAWLERIRRSVDNFRAAMHWFRESDQYAPGLRLAGASWRLWLGLGAYDEGRRWMDSFLAGQTGDCPGSVAKGRALLGSGVLAYLRNDLTTAESRYLEAKRLFEQSDEPAELGDVVNALGILATQKNEYPRAEAYLEEALALARLAREPFGIARALQNMAEVLCHRGELRRAEELYQECRKTYELIGDPGWSRVTSFLGMSNLYRLRGEYEQSRQLALTCIQFAPSVELGLAAEALEILGDCALAAGNFAEAQVRYTECLDQFEAVHRPASMAAALLHLAIVQQHRGNSNEARSMVRQSIQLQEETSVNERLAAWAQQCLGDIEREEGHLLPAAAHYRAAAENCSRTGNIVALVDVLERIGWMESLSPLSAAAMLGAAEGIRQRSGIALAPVDLPSHDAKVAALGQTLDASELHQAWTKGASMEWSESAAFALSELGE